MEDWTILLRPKLLTFRHRLANSFQKSRVKFLGMTALAIGFWTIVFFLFRKVLLYFCSMGPSGDLLNSGLLAIILLFFFSVLFLSNLITSLSTFFLSEDLGLILSRPVSLHHLYYARLAETIFYSSWMVLFFALPVLGAYGFAYRPSAAFYLALPAAFVPFLIIPSAIGTLLTMILVNVFPSRSTKNIVILLPILFVGGLYFLLRFTKPEPLPDPHSLGGLVEYIRAWLHISSRSFLPSFWVSGALMPLLTNTPANTGFFLGGLWLTAGATVVIGSQVSRALFFSGWTKFQEGRKISRSRSPFFATLLEMVSRSLNPQVKALVRKDIKVFFRDPVQWSKLILLTALVAVYLHSFSVLSLNRTPNFFLQNLFSFLNIGMAGFLLIAVSGRFAFTSVSQEGFSFWVIRSSPILLRTFLWNKFSTSLIPVLFLGEVMIFVSNWLLKVTPFMMILSSVTLFFMALGIVGLAVGLGAIYPRFKLENPARLSIGLSGTLYMILSMLFIGVIMALEIWPVYTIFMADYRHQSLALFQWAGIMLSFCGAALLTGIAVSLPLRLGLKNLTEMDF